jgi:catechol 2,3-dioxygenase-like lactoylglutathione lyase family enzyme
LKAATVGGIAESTGRTDMPLLRLDHVNVRTNRLGAMIEWYRDVLGMEAGPRPAFSFGGAWLYCGGHPIVHLVEVAEEQAAIAPRIEHFAISGSGLGAFLEHLEEKGVAYRLGRPGDFPIVQVNVHDPDGNHIHLDFPADEAQERTGGSPQP